MVNENGTDGLFDSLYSVYEQNLPTVRNLASKAEIHNYLQYLRWRRVVPSERIVGSWRSCSAPVVWQERGQTHRLQGIRYKVRGTIQYPAQRICS